MKITHFSDKSPEEVTCHLEEAGSIEIVAMFPLNNRINVFYKRKSAQRRERADMLKMVKKIENKPKGN